MKQLFQSVLDLGLNGSMIILVLLLLRLFPWKYPKWGDVALWGLAGLRLMIPFHIESRFSLIPEGATAGRVAMLDMSELPAAEQVIPASNVDILSLFSALWFVGAVFLAGYFVIRYWRILKKLDTAVLLRENIYQSEWISAPVVIGLLKPRIIVPFSMDETCMKHVIAHEKAHIRRGDHWWKLLAYGVLTLHWINPLVWIAYMLLGRDIELACDEAVIGKLDSEGRGDYAQTLLAFSAKSLGFPVYPMGFSSIDTKGRIKAIANYRCPGAGRNMLLAGCCLFLTVCFMTEPVMLEPEMYPVDHTPQLQEEIPQNTKAPSAHVPSEEDLRAEIEKLERSIAFYQGHLIEDRDLFVYKKVHEKADEDDLLGLRLSMAFYGRMIAELEHRIGFLQKQIAAL